MKRKALTILVFAGLLLLPLGAFLLRSIPQGQTPQPMAQSETNLGHQTPLQITEAERKQAAPRRPEVTPAQGASGRKPLRDMVQVPVTLASRDSASPYNAPEAKTASLFTTTDLENREPVRRFEKIGELAKADESRAEKPYDDLKGALEFEFNMTKDPATGKIPEGIFAAEREQANEIVKRQSALRIPEVAAYNFAGPDNLGGRTRAIAYDVRYNGTTNRIILAGGISGGVFKSIDDGATWVRKSPTGEHFSCTSIAQDTRVGSQDTWYYTVGEAIGNSTSATGATYVGDGVYKSTDNGETWVRLPASNTGALESFDRNTDLINRVVVDPTNGNVYIAALATILRSINGGTSWTAVLSGTLADTSDLTDIAVTSTGRFYAGFAGTHAAGQDGVWTSTDGAVWTRIAGPGGTPAGWPANAAYGRVVLAIAPSSENLVYAMFSNNFTSGCPGDPVNTVPGVEAGLFRWNQTTTTWTNLSATLPDEVGCTSGNDPFAVQGGYDLVVAVKPDDATTVFIAGTNTYRSTDSGATWTRIGGYAGAAGYAQYLNSHPDIHFIVFQPTSSITMLCGNDGGIQRTINDLAGTVAWTPINSGFRTYQYYYVANDPRSGNAKVIGGAQDNGTTRNVGGSGILFESVYSGDGASVGLTDPAATGGVQYEYVASQNGDIQRRLSTDPGGVTTDIKPAAVVTNGLFVTLFKLDPDNSERLYYANDSALYRTTSASTVAPGTWTSMTGIATAVSAVAGARISAIGLSRGAYSVATSSLFLGTSDGRVFRLDDPTGVAAATAPVNITGAGFPAAAYVSSISANPTNDDTVLVTFSNYGVTSVFFTGNANSPGPVWTAVEGTLTLPSYRSSAIVDTGAGGLQYFVGTSQGLYRTTGLPGLPAWTQEGSAFMGNAVASNLDLRASDNKLLVGTHGYGMWSAFVGGAPTAAYGNVDGTITDASGAAVGGVTINLSGTMAGETITDANGHYGFDGVETNGFYTVTPSRVNYTFSPANRSFSLLGVHTDASFTASANGAHLNAIDTTEFFVRQQYLDFLFREPDPPGFIGWVNTIRNCAAVDPNCDRIHVSEMFYRSQEFQERGYFAYRFYSTALGRKPDYAEFVPDLARVSGFLTDDELAAAKTAFVDDFMSRPAFASRYNSLGNAAYVDALINTAGVNLANRQSLIDALNARTQTRAQVLRQIAESGEVYQKYYNQAFVVMEYFGYLRRDPDALYTNWISVLDANPGDSRHMVDGFVNSAEYRNRFAQ
jgi:hypothetical protein